MRSNNTSHDRAGNGHSTIIDKDYPDYRPLAAQLGLSLADGPPSGGFSHERDWFYNSSGRNVATGGRWLVTLAHSDSDNVASTAPDPGAPATGWLIAYEIDRGDSKTGRVIVLAGPWTLHTDQVLHAECPLSDPNLGSSQSRV